MKKGSSKFHRWYDHYYCVKVKKRDPNFFGDGTFFQERNLEIVKVLKTIPVSNIFEFACTYGFLALEVAKEIPFKRYVVSNFLTDVTDYMKCQGLEEKGIEIKVFDANDILTTPLEEFDTFITTGFEHLEKDLEIISSLPKDSNFIFSVPNIEDPTHFRIFNSEQEISDRYNKVLNIKEIRKLQLEHMIKFVVYGSTKGKINE